MNSIDNTQSIPNSEGPMKDNNLVRDVLLGRYFELCAKEQIPKTPAITTHLDALEVEIRRHPTPCAT